MGARRPAGLRGGDAAARGRRAGLAAGVGLRSPRCSSGRSGSKGRSSRPWRSEGLKDPKQAAAWEAALRDPAFAADPEARSEWWARQTPYWDETIGLAPRVPSAATAAATLKPVARRAAPITMPRRPPAHRSLHPDRQSGSRHDRNRNLRRHSIQSTACQDAAAFSPVPRSPAPPSRSVVSRVPPPATTRPRRVAPTPSWIDRPMRWAQLTLVEDDPPKLDVDFWLDYFRRTRSDGVCLSAGGCVAYYPTQVPFHHRSAWLGDRDVFGELVAGCRRLGMVVLARTDPHATYDDVQAAHPDWIAIGADGRPRRHWASPEMWVTCGLGPYNFELMTAVKREIMSRYRVDGIFVNRWDGSGMCYCTHCRTQLPGGDGPRSPGRVEPAGGAASLPGVERGAPLRAVAGVGRGDPRDQPRLVPDTEHGRRRHESPRHEAQRRARADARRRSPGAPRPDAALGDRHEREGVPRGDGPQARRSASSASASRSRTAGRTRCRTARRSACGSPTSSPTGCAPGSRSSRPRSTTRAG